jgi:hypothetical protein
MQQRAIAMARAASAMSRAPGGAAFMSENG